MRTLQKNNYSVVREEQTISHPHNIANMVKGEFPTDGREAVVAIFVDTRHKPLGKPYVVSIGTLNASLVHPREVFHPAIMVKAAAIVLAHNHPSGDPTPSADDLTLTKRISEAGTLLGISLLDHVIVGDESEEFTSIREYGWPS